MSHRYKFTEYTPFPVVAPSEFQSKAQILLFRRWRPPTSPWFCLWVESGTLWRTLWSGIWWAAVTGRPSANSLRGGLVEPHVEHRSCTMNRAHDVFCRRLVLSTPFGVLSYLLLWFVPRGPGSPAVGVLWFLTATCLFETLMSVSRCCRYFLRNSTWLCYTLHKCPPIYLCLLGLETLEKSQQEHSLNTPRLEDLQQ